MAVNVDGVLNTVEPLVDRMMKRGHGQLALMASLASFIGLPYSASYNASKAAVRVWGESIRYVLRKHGIGVSVICPGFVATRISTDETPFPRPFLMTAAQASSIIRRGLARNAPRIAFPIGIKAAVWFGTTIPGRWAARLLGA
jgi:short-subunit dehydrogenase